MPDLLKFPMSAQFMDGETTKILFEHWVGSYPYPGTKVESGGVLYRIDRVGMSSTYNRMVVVMLPDKGTPEIDEDVLEKAMIKILQSSVV